MLLLGPRLYKRIAFPFALERESNIMALTETVVLLVLQLSCIACSTDQDATALHRLQLLVLVPMNNMDKEMTNCLDLGEELIPAAEIAADRINNNPDILSGFTLEILPATIDRCSDPSIAKALGSFAAFVNQTVQPGYNIVGLIGLVCPATLLRLSPIASLPAIDILQISSSTTSPSIVATSRKEGIGRLYQIAPSSTVFNKAVLALMRENSWKNISVIRHTDSISVGYDHIVSDFEQRVRAEGFGLSNYAEVASGLARFITNVVRSAVRIIYASVTDSEARELLCVAYSSGVVWPNYLWIFHDISLDDLLYNTSNCSVQVMHKAVEGIVLLQHHVNSEYDRTIDHANYTYGEYSALYNKTLQDVASHPTCNQEPDILSANALHDSVIAFACALNKSLPETELGCIGTQNCSATETVHSHLQLVSFSGAGGEIGFDPTTHELTVDSKVNIYRVISAVPCLFARFNGSITYQTQNPLSINYTFQGVIVRLPLALPVVTLAIVGLCTVITIVVSILFFHYRNSPDIKATSPLLSSIILFSCFLLYTSVVITTTRHGFASGQVYANLCASERFLYLVGVQLIFATLFIRLLRVSRIFFNYDPVGVAWSDKVLTLYIGAILSVTVILLVMWMAVGDFSVDIKRSFIPNGSPPHFNIEQSCMARHESLFLSLLFSYTGVLMLLVIVLAIKTRKVTIDVFKDTRSVNVYVFCSVGILALFVPLSFITETLPGITALVLSFVFQVATLIVVPTVCICLLFIPKLYMARFPSSSLRSKSVGKRTSSCFKATSDGFTLNKNSSYEQVKLKSEQP